MRLIGLALVLACLILKPLAEGQESTPRALVAFVGAEAASTNQHFLDAFRQGLHDQGYVDGDHPVIDRRAFVTIMGGSMLAVPLERGQGRLERWGENGGSVNSRPLYPPNAPVD